MRETTTTSVAASADRAEMLAAVDRLLAGSATMSLATAVGDEPWASGCFFVPEGLFELSIMLEARGQTLANIRSTGRAAVLISSGSPFEPFLQGLARTTVREDGEAVDRVGRALLAKSPQVEPFLGHPCAIVSLGLDYWKVTDVKRGWIPARVLSPEG